MSHDISTVYPLKRHRMHEACGAGAWFFAMAYAAQFHAQFLWIRENWQSETINPSGLLGLVAPENLLVAQTKNQTDTLATAEESLRSGVLSFVVMELSQPLTLTTGRRLQLAAKAGKSVGLAIIADGMGSNAAQTRWHCSPIHRPNDSTSQRWELKKNKSGTLGVWDVRWSASSRRINVVPPARK